MKTNYTVALGLGLLLGLGSCTKDLDRISETSLSSDQLYSSVSGYNSALAKIYAGLSMTGNAGPDGLPDLVGAGSGIGEGFESYIRNYFILQEYSTEEVIPAWSDNTIRNFKYMNWTPSDVYLAIMYSRFYYQITLANAFLKQATDAQLAARNITGTAAEAVRIYRAEARFLRALSYLHALDCFGNVTFVTEDDPVGTSFQPKRISRADLFAYLESECKAIETILPLKAEYGRVNRSAVRMLLANLYLNASVYTGQDKSTDALTYASKVISEGGFSLQPNYVDLFKADNYKSPEMIYAVEFNGTNSKTWGGMTFIMKAGTGGSMKPADYGIDDAWWGYRSTATMLNKYSATDKRARFYTTGQSATIPDIGDFFAGYPITKYMNVNSDGTAASSATYPDVDFPIYRLAETYLIYAEAVLRGGSGGSTAQALDYVNQLRKRAGVDPLTTLTLANIIDERARELSFECKRRTDLIRFGLFTSDQYVWPWKGNVVGGKGVESFRNLYPLPSSELNNNLNLKQNDGYN